MATCDPRDCQKTDQHQHYHNHPMYAVTQKIGDYEIKIECDTKPELDEYIRRFGVFENGDDNVE